MPEFDWLFGRPRDLARTPGFVDQSRMRPQSTYRDDDYRPSSYQTDDYGQPLGPTQPSLPERQPAQRLPEPPKRPNPGVLKSLGADMLSMVAPSAARRLKYGDYDSQMGDYQADMARRKAESDMGYKEAQIRELGQRGAAEISRAANYDAQADKARFRDPRKIMNHDQSLFNTDTGRLEFTAPSLPPKPSEMIELEEEGGALLKVAPGSDGKRRIPAGSAGNAWSAIARASAPPSKALAELTAAYEDIGETKEDARRLAGELIKKRAEAGVDRTVSATNLANKRTATAGTTSSAATGREYNSHVERLADRLQAADPTDIDGALARVGVDLAEQPDDVRQRVTDSLNKRKIAAASKNKKDLRDGWKPTSKPASGPKPNTPAPTKPKDPLGLR